MKKIIPFLGITTTIASLSFAASTFALETPREKTQFTNSQSDSLTHLRADKNWGKEKFTEKLNLTSQQQQDVQNIRSQYHPQILSLRENMRSERTKLREMMTSNQSEENLRSQHAKIMDLDQKIHSLRFDSMLEIRKVLTQQQRQQWAELMEERKANRRGRYR